MYEDEGSPCNICKKKREHVVALSVSTTASISDALAPIRVEQVLQGELDLGEAAPKSAERIKYDSTKMKGRYEDVHTTVEGKRSSSWSVPLSKSYYEVKQDVYTRHRGHRHIERWR